MIESTLDAPDWLRVIYNFNFAQDTSKELSYMKSAEVLNFMRKVIKIVKKSDIGIYEPFANKKKKAEQLNAQSINRDEL